VGAPFDAVHIAAFFDQYGVEEWDRHDKSASGRVSLAVHNDLLAELVQPGDLVLDAGAGPGRFTIELARLGARVHVCDLSPGQLELNREKVTEAGHEGAVVARDVLDVCDLSSLASGSFDAVVCFGGPLSYARDRAPDALAELARVTKPGGHVLVSVMSTLGAMRAFLPLVFDEHRRFGPEHTEHIFLTGELDRETNRGHEMRMFRWSEIAELCAAHGRIVVSAAANYLTAGADPALIEGLSEDEWQRLLSWERRLCREPGVLDSGTHILVAFQRPVGDGGSGATIGA
jgi:ubiquinone/menaquinone biosynthesis C-methylase UbiE